MRQYLRLVGLNLAVASFLILFVDVIASITVNRHSFRAISPVYHHGFVPFGFYREEWVPGSLIEEQINSYGMRANSSEGKYSQLKIDQYQTVLIGDSFAEGVGVPGSLTLPSLLPSSLGPIANLGVRSHSPTLSLLRLEHYKKIGLRPQYVIHLIDSSDIQDEYHYQDVEGFFSCSARYICPALQYLMERYMGRLYSAQILVRGVWWLHSKRFGNPNPFSVWGGRSNYYRLRNPYLPFKASYFERGLELMLSSVSKIRKVYPHSKYIPVVYPPRDIVASGSANNPYFNHVRTSIIELFRDDAGVTVCIPDRPLYLLGESLYIPQDTHWNARGHKHIAKYIADECIK